MGLSDFSPCCHPSPPPMVFPTHASYPLLLPHYRKSPNWKICLSFCASLYNFTTHKDVHLLHLYIRYSFRYLGNWHKENNTVLYSYIWLDVHTPLSALHILTFRTIFHLFSCKYNSPLCEHVEIISVFPSTNG